MTLTLHELKNSRKVLRRKLNKLNKEAAIHGRAMERAFDEKAISLLRHKAEDYRRDAKETAAQVSALTVAINALESKAVAA